MTYDLKYSELRDIMKLYPEIKIPYMLEYNYYLGLLSHTIDIDKIISEYIDCRNKYGDVGSHKMKMFDGIIKYFKEETSALDRFNELVLEPVDTNYNITKNKFEEDKIYMSIDLKEANWNSFKEGDRFAPNFNLGWKAYAKKVFNLHPFLINSKSYRQLIFGNLNPGRQQSVQKRWIDRLYKLLKDDHIVVSISSDEVVIEIQDGEEMRLIEWLNNIVGFPKLNSKTFTIKKVDNFEDKFFIKIPTDSESRNDWSFNGCPGNRFFMHYKTLILEESLSDFDMYFEPEPGKVAKWLIK